MNFIKTTDLETKEKLEKQGLKLISFDGKVATFLNDSKINFDVNENIVLSNKLEV